MPDRIATLLTREQAARIARECHDWPANEAEVHGEGGDLTVVLVDENGARLESFTINPDGEIV